MKALNNLVSAGGFLIGIEALLLALTKEMAAAALAMFGSDADHIEIAKLCERLAGTQLGKG